jgi:hypothetical protein
VMAFETGRSRARRPTLGYAVVLLGAALFVTSCFLPYYGVAGERSVSLYDNCWWRRVAAWSWARSCSSSVGSPPW